MPLNPRRHDLHHILEDILGSENVYFQPPATKLMSYPCIRYQLSKVQLVYAGDVQYSQFKSYQIIVIDANPDSDIWQKILQLPMCSFERFYTASNLNHFVLNIFY